MLLLALDTSTVACSAALLRAEAIVADEEQPMIRGHAEALFTEHALHLMQAVGGPGNGSARFLNKRSVLRDE